MKGLNIWKTSLNVVICNTTAFVQHGDHSFSTIIRDSDDIYYNLIK